MVFKCRYQLFLLIFSLMITNCVFAVTIKPKLDFSNRYIWRGFDANPDNHYVIQPSFDLSFPESHWSFNIWYSFSAENHELNELDLTFNYDFQISSDVSVSAGIIHYGWYQAKNFSSEENTTIETYFSFAWKKQPLSPTISFNHDCKNGNGLYAQLALSKSFAISQSQNLELSTTIGYNQKQWISRSGLSEVAVTASLPIVDGTNTITPFVGISWPLMNEINPGVNREYWMGLSLEF
ncbi:MAG: hypothetical protein Kow0029_15910 [Candidatus Rifleibacteriota bacterium]